VKIRNGIEEIRARPPPCDKRPTSDRQLSLSWTKHWVSRQLSDLDITWLEELYPPGRLRSARAPARRCGIPCGRRSVRLGERLRSMLRLDAWISAEHRGISPSRRVFECRGHRDQVMPHLKFFGRV
jgi:hypothetical protein